MATLQRELQFEPSMPNGECLLDVIYGIKTLKGKELLNLLERHGITTYETLRRAHSAEPYWRNQDEQTGVFIFMEEEERRNEFEEIASLLSTGEANNAIEAGAILKEQSAARWKAYRALRDHPRQPR